ncbi:13886_t:CDS:1, partial [Gigaspora rosea]
LVRNNFLAKISDRSKLNSAVISIIGITDKLLNQAYTSEYHFNHGKHSFVIMTTIKPEQK